MQPSCKICLSVPLCHLPPLPLVRPILEVDVQLLKNKFINGYCKGNRLLYIYIMDDRGRIEKAFDATLNGWNEHW